MSLPPSLIAVQRSHSGGSASDDGNSGLPPGFLALVRQATTVQRLEHQWSAEDVGCRVRVRLTRSGHEWAEGTVAYIGTTQKTFTIGAVLDEPVGQCDGKLGGKRYFRCIASHGVFRAPDDVLFVGQLSATPVDTQGWPISDERKAALKASGDEAISVEAVGMRARLRPEEIRLAAISRWDWYGDGASRREREWKRFTPYEEAKLTKAFLRRQTEITLPEPGGEKGRVAINLDWMLRSGLVGKSTQSRQIRGTVLGQRAMPNRDLLGYPERWETQTDAVQLFDVVEGSSEWLHVDAMMRTHKDYVTPEPERCGMDGNTASYRTVRVKRVQNLKLWESYELKREIIKERSRSGNANERWLFHGTRSCPPEKIYKSTQAGFDHRRAGNGYHGCGTYFSTAAQYSSSYGHSGQVEGCPTSDGSWMFVARCAVGVPKIHPVNEQSKGIYRPPLMTDAEAHAVADGVPWNKVRCGAFDKALFSRALPGVALCHAPLCLARVHTRTRKQHTRKHTHAHTLSRTLHCDARRFTSSPPAARWTPMPPLSRPRSTAMQQPRALDCARRKQPSTLTRWGSSATWGFRSTPSRALSLRRATLRARRWRRRPPKRRR